MEKETTMTPARHKKAVTTRATAKDQPPEGMAADAETRGIKTGISGGLAGFGIWRVFGVDRGIGAHVGPVDVGSHVFAADEAVSGPLDGWATVGGNRPHTILPLRNNRWSDANASG